MHKAKILFMLYSYENNKYKTLTEISQPYEKRYAQYQRLYQELDTQLQLNYSY